MAYIYKANLGLKITQNWPIFGYTKLHVNSAKWILGYQKGRFSLIFLKKCIFGYFFNFFTIFPIFHNFWPKLGSCQYGEFELKIVMGNLKKMSFYHYKSIFLNFSQFLANFFKIFTIFSIFFNFFDFFQNFMIF